MITQYILLAALLGVLVSLAATGRWRTLPVFTVWVSATAVQGLAHWRSEDATLRDWLCWVGPMAALKLAVCVEAFWRRTGGMQDRLGWILACSCVAAGSVYMASWIPDTMDPWTAASTALLYFETALVGFILLGFCVTAIYWRSPRFLFWHSWLLVPMIGTPLVGLLAYGALPAAALVAEKETIAMWTNIGAACCYASWISLICNGPDSSPADGLFDQSVHPAPRLPA